MKVQDLMLDLFTGDASVHDPEIAAACGRVDVSCAIGEAAIAVYEQAVGKQEYDNEFIQEAAKLGFVMEADTAEKQINQSWEKAAGALVDVTYTIAKKLNEKLTIHDKIFSGLAKHYGLEGGDLSSKVKTICTKVAKEKGTINLSNKVATPSAVNDIVSYYIGRTADFCEFANITLSAKRDPIVGNYLRTHHMIKKHADNTDLPSVETTTSIDANGIRDILVALHAAKTLAADISGLSSSDIESCKATIAEGFRGGSDKAQQYFDSAREYKKVMQKISGLVVKVFGDNTYAIVDALENSNK